MSGRSDKLESVKKGIPKSLGIPSAAFRPQTKVLSQSPRATTTVPRHGAGTMEVSPSPPCDATAAKSEQKGSRGAYRSRRKPSEARPFETGVQEATPLAEQLREPCQFDYDRARYPFAELVAEALGLSDPTALATFACCADM